ncbi:MAG: nitroreductase family protein [Bacteroidales bacterium]
MKSIHILCILMAVALIVLIIRADFKPIEIGKKSASSTADSKGVLEIIHQRKSVRSFTEQKVSNDDLLTIVKAGMASPTARNAQPWKFIIITDDAMMDTLSARLPYAKMLKDASAAIIVCGDLDKALTGADENYWSIDCAMASENILLAVESMGLGAVFTAVWPYPEREVPVRAALELPDNLRPLNVIPVGYPTGVDKPKDKWKPENLYWNGVTSHEAP